MTNTDVIKILDGWNCWNKNFDVGIFRPLYLNKFSQFSHIGQIIVVTGARRVGKSFLLKQFADHLLQTGYAKNETLLVNFEDPGFAANLNTDLLDKIFDQYSAYQKPLKKPFIFLDEIQNIPGWERWVRTIHEQNRANIIISGSNATLLSQELASLLTGRHLDISVFPLSLTEFLNFKNQDSTLREYLNFGGFPKVVLEHEKTELLLSYFTDILEKDIIKRYHIRKEEKVKLLGKFLLGNIGSPITYRSLEKTLEISQETAEKFTAYMESSFLTFLVKKFSFRMTGREKSPRKIYSQDCGLANIVGFRFSENLGHLAENAVAAGLLRAKSRNPEMEFYYFKDEKDHEVDFLVKTSQKVTDLIQVCWDFTTKKTQEREVRSLVKAMKIFELKEATILTESGGENIETDGLRIRILPLSSCNYLLD